MSVVDLSILITLIICVIIVVGVLACSVFADDEENDRDDFEQEEDHV